MATKLLSLDQAAELLSQPPATLRYWRHIGNGPPSARIGRRVFYRESDIAAFIEQQFTGGSA